MCIAYRLSFSVMKHRVSAHVAEHARPPPERRPAYASDTEIMFKNDSPVAVPVECDRKQRQLESPVSRRCVTTRTRRSQTSNSGRRPAL